MNRLNLGSAYYNALEAVATKRYTNGVMFAVNYTLMKLEDALNFITAYDDRPYRDLQGDQRRHRLVITTLVDLPFGPGKAIGRDTTGVVAALIGRWQFNTIGEIQAGRPLALNGSAILLDDDVSLPKSEQSFTRWFDNSTTSNRRPDGTYAWDVIGQNDYRQVGFRFHDVNEPTEPQWSFSLFKNTRVSQGVNMQIRVETFNVFNIRLYGGPNTDPTQRELRHREHREPGELPAHDPDRRQVPVLNSGSGLGARGSENECRVPDPEPRIPDPASHPVPIVLRSARSLHL